MVFGLFSGAKNHGAVLNALNAKITFDRLSEDDRRNVVHQARMLVGGGGNPDSPDALLRASSVDLDSRDEFSRCTLYSIAMISLLIPPAIEGEDWAHPLDRPLVYTPNRKEIELGVAHFKRKYGMTVSISSAHRDFRS